MAWWLTDTNFASQLMTEVMFRILQVIESTIKLQNPDKKGTLHSQLVYPVKVVNQKSNRAGKKPDL